jgi:hypothetical protein
MSFGHVVHFQNVGTLKRVMYNNFLHRTPQTVTIFAEQECASVYYAGEQGVRGQVEQLTI